MGFSKEASRQALMDNGNNLEAALNVLLNSNKQKPVTGPPLRGIILNVPDNIVCFSKKCILLTKTGFCCCEVCNFI